MARRTADVNFHEVSGAEDLDLRLTIHIRWKRSMANPIKTGWR